MMASVGLLYGMFFSHLLDNYITLVWSEVCVGKCWQVLESWQFINYIALVWSEVCVGYMNVLPNMVYNWYVYSKNESQLNSCRFGHDVHFQYIVL